MMSRSIAAALALSWIDRRAVSHVSSGALIHWVDGGWETSCPLGQTKLIRTCGRAEVNTGCLSILHQDRRLGDPVYLNMAEASSSHRFSTGWAWSSEDHTGDRTFLRVNNCAVDLCIDPTKLDTPAASSAHSKKLDAASPQLRVPRRVEVLMDSTRRETKRCIRMHAERQVIRK